MTQPPRSLKDRFLAVIDRLSGERDSLLAEKATNRQTSDLKWELTADHPELEWTAVERDILYQLEGRRGALSAHLTDAAEPVNTFILGFNPEDSTLMIDTFWPSLHANLAAVGRDLHLKIESGAYTLHMQVSILDLVKENEAHAFTARVVNKTLNRDRRVNPRVNFAPADAPQVHLLIPLTGVLRGTVANLSKGGMEMRCLCPTRPKLESPFGECTLYLSEALQIRCDIKIRNLQWLRQPHNHLRISMIFIGLTTDKTDQISAFISSFTPDEASSRVA